MPTTTEGLVPPAWLSPVASWGYLRSADSGIKNRNFVRGWFRWPRWSNILKDEVYSLNQ